MTLAEADKEDLIQGENILVDTWVAGWLSSKESTCEAGDVGSLPRSGQSTREGNGNPLQHSCLGNLMDRGAWWATVHRVSKSQTRLSDSTKGS